MLTTVMICARIWEADDRRSLGLLVISVNNLEAKQIVDEFYTKLEKDEVKESFKKWGSSIDKIRMESKPALGIDDFNSVASLLGSPTTEYNSWLSIEYVHLNLIAACDIAPLGLSTTCHRVTN